MERHLTKEIKDLDVLIAKALKNGNKNKEVLNHTQLQILFYLNKHFNEEVCQKDLEIKTHLKKASITGALDSLQDKGIIERKTSIEDKRKNIIVLSEKALKEKDKIKMRFEEIENELKKNISQKELNEFYSIINKMKANLS